MRRTIRVRGIIEHHGKYLFVKHAPASDYWALPGGHVEPGESVITAMEREIIEELGVKPKLGRVLYINQFFTNTVESLELFFDVTNGGDFVSLDLDATSHGRLELSAVAFIDPRQERILPEFLSHLAEDSQTTDWPKVFVDDHRSV